jgi:hypothetical protein
MPARTSIFAAVEPVGGLLPADMLLRIAAAANLRGSSPADYRVVGARSVRDAAERHWDYLRAVWKELRDKLPVAPGQDVPADPTGIAVSQWLEPLFAELGFGRLTTVGAAGLQADNGTTTFPVSHRWNNVPVHLVPWNADLDKRYAGGLPPHSMVQECLNRTDANLWGILSNGRQLRLLRDSNALATVSYLEFDLESIFDGELFSEFVLLYRLLHVSRFETTAGVPATTCWLEKWRAEAITSGTRALEALSDGVRDAVTVLGTGFLQHPANENLRRDLDVHAFHTALLRLAYRLIFWFVAEDRDVLHPEEVGEQERRRYADYFSSQRLRRLAMRYRGTAHADLYHSMGVVFAGLGAEAGRPELGLPGLGGLFDDTAADAPLRGLALANHHLLEAVRKLCRVRDDDSRRWRQVDYEHMDSEELGSVYESLLEYVPVHSAVERTFELVNRLGNDRKKTGSYYTPTALIETLLDATLDPVIDDAQKRGEQQALTPGLDQAKAIVEELLALTVCDPACGSGHFLVAAARRIAKRVAAVREGNPEPTRGAVRHALHEVVARCVYGVDLNPMAVELAKVSLWLEALEPGLPLSFLDVHIRCGDGLIGATPALIRDGIPNKAFKPVEGDDPKVAASLERDNAARRIGQGSLLEVTAEMRAVGNSRLAEQVRRITEAPADTLVGVHRQASAYEQWRASDDFTRDRLAADAWCAAFFWHKAADAPIAITHEKFKAIRDNGESAVPKAVLDEVVRLRDEFRFFHWHLEFPEIFDVPENGVDTATGWTGGFSCVLANPPWDKLDFEDKKYFSIVEPTIAEMSGVTRRNRIAAWECENPEAGERYRAARRRVKSTFLFVSVSGVFPLCSKGLTVKGVNSLQTDQLFAERFETLVAAYGRIGCIIPTAIATNAGAQHLFSALTQRGAISLLHDFENRKPIFPGVHASYKFCLLSLTGPGLREPAARLAFFLEETADLDDPSRVFSLTPEEIALINPNTGGLPIFRTRRDADLAAAIYRRIPVLWEEKNPNGNRWGITFKNLFNMTDDSDLFRGREQLEAEGWTLQDSVFVRGDQRMLPLYEAKMLHHFDHRWNSFTGEGDNDRRRLSSDEKREPVATAQPRKWIAEEGLVATVRNGKAVDVPGVSLRLDQVQWEHDWLCGWRDICRTTDERTAITAFLPRVAVGHKFPLMFPRVPADNAAALIAAQSSLVFDYVSRQKVGGVNMGLFIWKQLPVPTPQMMRPHLRFIVPRVLELVWTAYDMVGLARELGDPEDLGPFVWDEDRRAGIRAELDALFFHIYGVSRDDVDYVLETFQTATGGLKNNEIAKYGSYRTKELVLAEYDRMAAAGVSLDTPPVDGAEYVSTFTPPPGHGPRHPAAPTA